MLKIIYFRHNNHLPTVPISPKQINCYELTFVLDGEMVYVLDGVSYLAKKGSLIFVKPKTIRARNAIANMDYISFNFTASEDPIQLPTILNDVLTGSLKLLLKSFENIYDHTLNFEDERLNLLLQCIFLEIEHQKEKKIEHPLVSKIMQYVKGRITERLTLEDISKITFFSPSYCEFIFKRETGKSIIDYIIDQRITAAKNLLMEGTLRTTEIAELTGFSDYNYFSRVFKKRTGYTPTEYTKNFNI